MNVLDLFSGIGAFALGMQRAGFRHAAFCEIDPFARRVLEKHWPGVPCHHDIRALRGFNRVAGICGGFPCQPFSTASRGRRVAVDLWPEMQRLVDGIRPDWVIAENVQEEAIALAAERLNELGYPTYYRRISGTDIGADHIRNRWWLVAHPDAEGELHGAIDAEVAKLPALCAGLWGPGNYARAIRVLDGPATELDLIRGVIGEQNNYSKTEPAVRKLIWEILRTMWRYRSLAASSPHLYRGRLRDLVPNLPQERAYEGWLLGAWIEKDERLRSMFQSIHAKPFDEQDMLPEMLERIRSKKRPKALGSRADRVGSIGNAVFPQIPEALGRAIMNNARPSVTCRDCGYRDPCDDECPNALAVSRPDEKSPR